MNISREQKIEKSVELLNKLKIYKPYIDGFKEDELDNICYFEHFAGFWAFIKKELIEKIKELEEKTNCKVYAATHEYFEFGECYSLLLIPDYEEYWKYLLTKENNVYYAFAYVWNKTDNLCSEYGTIGLKSFGGGITRIY